MYSVIDIGTGSIKTSIYQNKDGIYSDVAFKSTDFRLIDPVSKQISQHAQQEALAILRDILSFIKKYDNSQIICIATYSLRSAGNAQAFLDIVNRELGISVNIIPGEKEAQLITDSVRAIEQVDKFFTFDIGGGSIEFSVVDNKLVDSISKNIGIINLATLLKKQSHSSDIHMSNMLDDVRDIVSSNLSELRKRHDLSQYPLICTGGSLVIANEILKVGNVLKYEIISDFFEKIHPMTYSERIQFGIPPGKIDVFDVALAVTLAVMDISGKRVITVSRAGVRHGAAINHHLFL